METLQSHFTWRKPVKRWDVFLLARCQSSSRPMQVGHRRDSWPLRLGHLEIWCQNWGLWGCEDWRPLFRIHHFQNGLIWKCLKFATEIKFPLPEVNPSQTHNSGGAGGPYQGQSDSSVAGSKMGSEDGLQRRGPSKQSTFAIGSLYCFCYDILIFPLLTSPELWRLLNLLFVQLRGCHHRWRLSESLHGTLDQVRRQEIGNGVLGNLLMRFAALLSWRLVTNEESGEKMISCDSLSWSST